MLNHYGLKWYVLVNIFAFSLLRLDSTLIHVTKGVFYFFLIPCRFLSSSWSR